MTQWLRILCFQLFGAALAIVIVAGLVDMSKFAYATSWLIWIVIALLGMIAGGQIGSARA
jgi:hypothetical protein